MLVALAANSFLFFVSIQFGRWRGFRRPFFKYISMDALRTITSDILGIANKLGAIKRREDIDSREIELWINHYRELWILANARVVPGTQNKRIYPDLFPSLYQDLGCRLLTCLDQSECATLPVGAYISKIVIPAPVEIHGSLWIGLINKRTKFIETTASELEGKLAAPYGGKFMYYWRTTGTNAYVATSDGELYRDLCYVNVREICADPRQACYKKSLTTAQCCYDPKTDLYPAMGDMIEWIKLQILTKEFNIAMQFLKDETDNNRDDRQRQQTRQT